jgi:hypothetical protein
MANCSEEVALELPRAALESQDGSENQLREKATAVLSAASIVVPVAAVALGSAPAGATIPFGVAALAYLWCVRSCGSALFPKNRQAGLLGGEMLQLTTDTGADLPQMQASAASYLDGFYKHNQVILEGAADKGSASTHCAGRRDRCVGRRPRQDGAPGLPGRSILSSRCNP